MHLKGTNINNCFSDGISVQSFNYLFTLLKSTAMHQLPAPKQERKWRTGEQLINVSFPIAVQGGGVSRENITKLLHFNMIHSKKLNILQH